VLCQPGQTTDVVKLLDFLGLLIETLESRRQRGPVTLHLAMDGEPEATIRRVREGLA
jgi:hypothetical protein